MKNDDGNEIEEERKWTIAAFHTMNSGI